MEGNSVCKGGPRLSHLFFVDDILIFCKASIEECDSLHHPLKMYEIASGQQVNRAKTSLFFNSNIAQGIQDEVKSRFGAQVIRQHEK